MQVQSQCATCTNLKRAALKRAVFIVSVVNAVAWIPLAECFFFHAALIPYLVAVVFATISLSWTIQLARGLAKA